MIKNQSEIISKVLSPALRLWLRSQVEQVEALQIKISGRDRQILRGYIPRVFLASTRAVYQGLHLAEVELTGENIRINLAQVLKGKPLRLLEPLSVKGNVLLEEADLKASLSSSLLSQALTELLLTLLQANGIDNPNNILEDYRLSWHEFAINPDKLTLTGTLTDAQRNTIPVTICAGLGLANGQTLRLHPLQIEALPELFDVSLNEFQVDLGSEVELEHLSLAPGKLSCSGRLTVRS